MPGCFVLGLESFGALLRINITKPPAANSVHSLIGAIALTWEPLGSSSDPSEEASETSAAATHYATCCSSLWPDFGDYWCTRGVIGREVGPPGWAGDRGGLPAIGDSFGRRSQGLARDAMRFRDLLPPFSLVNYYFVLELYGISS